MVQRLGDFSINRGWGDNSVSIGAVPAANSSEMFHLSPGEIHFLWWFTQGMIMCPDVRRKLREAWGLCERHAWGWLSTEAAFGKGYMLRPAIVYEDLMEQTVAAFDVCRPRHGQKLRRNLREKGPCFMCQSGYGPDTTGIVKPELVTRGGNLSELRALADMTFPYWGKAVCGRCALTGSPVRCRKHFLEEVTFDSADEFHRHKEFVTGMLDHLVKYRRSYRWGFHDTRTEEDAAALIMAVGWCSGWRILLSIMGEGAQSLDGN